jgi:BirA family transcriptional regulator, biotin operon repressor / biotin---[acetyl-CoA-carboxylase] ligase
MIIGADLARAIDVVAARGGRLGSPLSVVPETTSTNDDAKLAAKAGAPHGAVWVAESQTRGRGRQGRAWLSAPNENLLFSVLLRVRCAPVRVPPLALVCGLAVRDAVARAVGDDERVVLKWPNDVMVRSAADGRPRKVAGVLVESALSGGVVEHVICGIGINVRSRALPSEISALATSVDLERDPAALAGEIDRAVLLADVLEGLDRDAELVLHKGLGAVHTRLARHDGLLGREVVIEGTRGIAEGIDREGRLLVRTADGALVRAVSGEALGVPEAGGDQR